MICGHWPFPPRYLRGAGQRAHPWQYRGIRKRRRLPLSLQGTIRRKLFGVSLEEARFARRGFHVTSPPVQQHLEEVATTFLDGYHAGLVTDHQFDLTQVLASTPLALQGFAFEGAAMALALLDRVTPWNRQRWRTFREGAGEPHAYMMHVGAGWAMARLHQSPSRMLEGFDPILRWLVIDGYGFHQGFFSDRQHSYGQPHAKSLRGYAARAFDQGLGRSLWFSQCADVTRIGDAIHHFHTDRRADLWSGVGLAAAYAGGVDAPALRRLRQTAADYDVNLAQGCSFAAKARIRAGNVEEHTELACHILAGQSAEASAAVSDEALATVLASSERLETRQPDRQSERVPAYELWRQQVRRQLSIQGANA